MRQFIDLILEMNGPIKDDPDFSEWFAGSKVVDGSGKPLAVYHGTRVKEKFDRFHVPDKAVVGPYGSPDHLKDIHKVYFANDRKVAATYGGQVVKAHLSLKNPLILDASGESSAKFFPSGYINSAVQGGHDGIIVHNLRDNAAARGEATTIYIVFDPDNIWMVNRNKPGN